MSALNSEHPQEASWSDAFSVDRKGAGYFRSQSKDFNFCPKAYIRFRAVKRDESLSLIDEWARWLSDIKTSEHGGARRAAIAASSLTQEDLNDYYRRQILTNRQLVVLQNSSDQLGAADQQFTSHVQRLQREPDLNASTTPPGSPSSATSLWLQDSPPSYLGTTSTTAITGLSTSTVTPGQPVGSFALISVPGFAPLPLRATSTTATAGLSTSAVTPGQPVDSFAPISVHSGGLEPATALNASAVDGQPITRSNNTTASNELPAINNEERTILLSEIGKITHNCPEESCPTCNFKTYQRLCVEALVDNQLSITDIADVVALIEVLP
ncbi:hypothetical protein BGX27_002054, partial [Mortierella sp. AM989]